MLEVTITNAYLPFFYQEGLLDCVPYPISEIAPGMKISDDGAGVYLDREMSAELLRQTVLGENGYRSHPKVTSGPYKLVSFGDGRAEFEINTNYKGNSRGDRPSIEKITMVSLPSDEMAQALKDGKIPCGRRKRETQLPTAGSGWHSKNDLLKSFRRCRCTRIPIMISSRAHFIIIR